MERNDVLKEQNQLLFDSLHGKRKEDFFTNFFESEVAFALRQLRLEKGLKQKDIAERSGLKQANISKIENLEKTPTLTTIGKYLYALDFSLEDTYEFVENIFIKSIDENELVYIDSSNMHKSKINDHNYLKAPRSLKLSEMRV